MSKTVAGHCLSFVPERPLLGSSEQGQLQMPSAIAPCLSGQAFRVIADIQSVVVGAPFKMMCHDSLRLWDGNGFLVNGESYKEVFICFFGAIPACCHSTIARNISADRQQAGHI